MHSRFFAAATPKAFDTAPSMQYNGGIDLPEVLSNEKPNGRLWPDPRMLALLQQIRQNAPKEDTP